MLGRIRQAIALADLPDGDFLLVGFDLAAAASSGFAIESTAGSAFQVLGNHLAFHGGGACTVVAHRDGKWHILTGNNGYEDIFNLYFGAP